MALLSFDLVSPVEYTAGNELDFNLHFEAPANTEAEKFYILGGLYTDTAYISGSLFGILKPAEVDYAINDPAYISIWELEPGEGVDLPCKFILSGSDCLLVLFLMRMVGDEPSLDDDEELAQIQIQLTAPVPAEEEIATTIAQSIIPLVAVGLALGVVGFMARGMFKGD